MLAVRHDQHKSKPTSLREAIKLLKGNSYSWMTGFHNSLRCLELQRGQTVIFYWTLLLNLGNFNALVISLVKMN